MISCMRINGTITYTNKDGEIHREDGPAVIFNIDSIEPSYCLHGTTYPYREWLTLVPNGLVHKWKEHCETV